MDLAVSPDAPELMRRGVAENTTRAHRRARAQFAASRESGPGVMAPARVKRAVPWAARTALPATGETLLEYTTYHY